MSSGGNGDKSASSTTLKATAAEFVPKGFLKPTAPAFVPSTTTTSTAPVQAPPTASGPIFKPSVVLPGGDDDDDDDLQVQFGNINIDKPKSAPAPAPEPEPTPAPVPTVQTVQTPAPVAAPTPAPAEIPAVVKGSEPKVEKSKEDNKPSSSKDTFEKDKKPHSQSPRNDFGQGKPSSGWGRGSDNGHNNQHPIRGGMSLKQPTEQADDSGWKRGESVKGLPLIGRQDGVIRYDRATLVGVFEKGNTAPECMSTFYPSFCHEERSPMSKGKGAKGKKKENEIDPEDSKEFRKGLEDENVFKFIPGRLENADDAATIVSKAKAILNKLTVDKFDKLANDFMNVGLVNSRSLLLKGVEMIVLKAQMEEHFCFMYADLCVKLMSEWKEPVSLLKDDYDQSETTDTIEENTKKEDTDPSMTQGKFFRNNLLQRCSAEFEVDREKALEEIRMKEMSEEDKLEQVILLKKRYTGHMRFIGELYVKKIIRPNIMHTCISDLLKGNSEEETLVCLCKLMETIGSKLEQFDIKEKKKKAADAAEENSADVEAHFEKIKIITKEHPSSRIRFMMKDLIELRENGWQSRRQTEKPKTLEEIRAEAEEGQNNSGKPSPRVQSSNVGPRPFSSNDNLTQDARNQSGFRRMNSAPNSQSSTPRGQQGQSMHRTNSGGNIVKSHNNGHEKKEWGNNKNESKWGKPASNNDTKGSSKKESISNEELRKAPALTRQESRDTDYTDIDASQPGYNGEVSKDVLKKLKPMLEEYIAGLSDKETIEEINELIHANGMGDVMKTSFLFSVDKKDSDRDAIVTLLLSMHNSKLLTSKTAVAGMYGILDDFDDCLIDSPLIGLYLAKLLAKLVANDVLDLSFLGRIPSENNFAESSRGADFIIATLSEIVIEKGEETTIKLFKDANINILEFVKGPPPRQTKAEVLEEISNKYKISIALKNSLSI